VARLEGHFGDTSVVRSAIPAVSSARPSSSPFWREPPPSTPEKRPATGGRTSAGVRNAPPPPPPPRYVEDSDTSQTPPRHDNTDKLQQVFSTLGPDGESPPSIAASTLFRFVQANKLAPPGVTRAKLEAVIKSAGTGSRRPGRLDFEAFRLALDRIGDLRSVSQQDQPSWSGLRTVLAEPNFASAIGSHAKPEPKQLEANPHVLPELAVSPQQRVRSAGSACPRRNLSQAPRQRASRQLSQLWYKEKRPLRDMFDQYATQERDERSQTRSPLDRRTAVHVTHHGMSVAAVAQMAADFDLIPTLYGRNEVKRLYHEVLAASNGVSETVFGSLGFEPWLDLLERIAVAKFPAGMVGDGAVSAVDAQVAAIMQWMDASRGKLKLRDRQRSGVLVRKFSVSSKSL